MKSPEEIKQSIRICAILDENHDCTTCPRFPDEYTDCSNHLLLDALAYMEQLEERIDLMILQMRGDCGTCKHKDEYGETCQACMFSLKPNRPCWEYEGLPELTRHEKPV